MTRNQKNAPKPTTKIAPSSASRAHGIRIDRARIRNKTAAKTAG